MVERYIPKEEVKPKRRSRGLKRQCLEAFQSSGAEAAGKLGIKLGVNEKRLRRWLKKWSNGEYELAPQAGTHYISAKARAVTLSGKGEDEYLGYVIEEGEQQSLVRWKIHPVREQIGETRCYANSWLISAKQ